MLYCQITGEKILTIGNNGVTKRENYVEVWFELSDGSRMRVAMSKNAKEQLKEIDADEVYRKIKKEWSDAIKNKIIPAKQKALQLARINKLTYKNVEGRAGVIINKQKNGAK